MAALPAVPLPVEHVRRLVALPLRPLEPVRRGLGHQVRRTLGGDGTVAMPPAFTDPPGDPGLFGPGSMTWRVHGDLPGMLIGGISALFLQSLHPLAMAGVDQHSAYREDPMGRLRRTGDFIGTTTYASTEAAEQACATVRAIHGRVRGTAPDGRPYAASEPDLLRWVHVTEVGSFLRAYQRYSLTPLSSAEADRYLDEVAVVAELLGATDVPRSTVEVRAYLRDVRPELEGGELALGAPPTRLPAGRAGPSPRGARRVRAAAPGRHRAPARVGARAAPAAAAAGGGPGRRPAGRAPGGAGRGRAAAVVGGSLAGGRGGDGPRSGRARRPLTAERQLVAC